MVQIQKPGYTDYQLQLLMLRYALMTCKHKVKAKVKVRNHRTKVKDCEMCARWSSRPRTCSWGLHHWELSWENYDTEMCILHAWKWSHGALYVAEHHVNNVIVSSIEDIQNDTTSLTAITFYTHLPHIWFVFIQLTWNLIFVVSVNIEVHRNLSVPPLLWG